MRNRPSLEPRLIPRTKTRHRACFIAGLFLLGGCQELSCALSSDIDGLASMPGAENTDRDVADVEPGGSVEVEVEATPKAEPDGPTPGTELPAPSEAVSQHPSATLVHFKAVAEQGWRATLSAKIDLRVPDKAEAQRLAVHGKARCHAEGNIETSTASVEVSRLDSWDLDFFSGHDDVPFDQCQIDLRLGDESGALHVPLGTFCFADDTTSSGPCPQPVAVRTPEATKSGLAMLDTRVKVDDGIEVDFELQPTRNAGHELEVTGRALCRVEDAYFLVTGSQSFEGGAFDFEPGEVYGGEFTVFDDDKWSDLDLDKATCQISFEAEDLTLYGDEHPHRFHTACVTGGEVEDGACKGFPEASFVEADDLDALKVAGVDAEFATSLFSSEKALRFGVEFIATGPVGGTIYAEVACKTDAGRLEQRSRWDGTDAVLLRRGESAKVWIAHFGDPPDAEALKWCELKLTSIGEEKPWAQFCWNGRKTREGACG